MFTDRIEDDKNPIFLDIIKSVENGNIPYSDIKEEAIEKYMKSEIMDGHKRYNGDGFYILYNFSNGGPTANPLEFLTYVLIIKEVK